MEQYLRHLMLQWQDREADLRWATMSVQLATNLRTLPACVVSMTPCMIKVGLNAKSMHMCVCVFDGSLW